MHIFVDESGSFTVPARTKRPSISCVGAVILPSSEVESVIHDFAAMAAPWANASGEVKGSKLNEAQISTFLDFLSERRGLVKCVAVDMALHRIDEVLAHRDEQARKLTANLTHEHHPNLVAAIHILDRRLRALKVPNYVQLVAYTCLANAVIRNATTYIVQRRPDDIGTLDWTFDAKGHPITEMEDLWQTLVKPFLQSSFLRDPLPVLDWCDYSAFDAAFQSDLMELPEYLRAHTKSTSRERERPLDVKRLLRRLRFASSAACPGLQMADIATNTVRRMLMGNLQEEGWRRLGSVLVQPARFEEVVHMIQLTTSDRRWDSEPYRHALLAVRATALPMLADCLERTPRPDRLR